MGPRISVLLICLLSPAHVYVWSLGLPTSICFLLSACHKALMVQVGPSEWVLSDNDWLLSNFSLLYLPSSGATTVPFESFFRYICFHPRYTIVLKIVCRKAYQVTFLSFLTRRSQGWDWKPIMGLAKCTLKWRWAFLWRHQNTNETTCSGRPHRAGAIV